MIYGKLLCFVQVTLQFSSFLKSGELDDHEKYFVDMPQLHMSHLLLLGKFEYGGGPIFKVVLEC